MKTFNKVRAAAQMVRATDCFSSLAKKVPVQHQSCWSQVRVLSALQNKNKAKKVPIFPIYFPPF